MTYRVLLIESDEGFAVFCPALPGCCSQGATEGEAMEMIADAISEWLDAGGTPAKDGGVADEAQIVSEAAEDRAEVIVREVRLPVSA
jgi:predicted RNase H-like HicB family nuclease